MSINKKKAGTSSAREESVAKTTKSKPAARTAASRPKAKTSASAAKSSAARPRIRSNHSEVPDAAESVKTTRKPKAKPTSDLERRKVKARASVRALSAAKEIKKPLAAAPKREEGARSKRSVPPSGGASEASKKLALEIASAGLDKKAIGVEVIDVSGRVDYADFLVIMTGTSDRHVHAIAMGIEESLKRLKLAPLSVEGLNTASWVLMDFDDIVVHVFQEETRRIYDIEGLWVDAGRLGVDAARPS